MKKRGMCCPFCAGRIPAGVIAGLAQSCLGKEWRPPDKKKGAAAYAKKTAPEPVSEPKPSLPSPPLQAPATTLEEILLLASDLYHESLSRPDCRGWITELQGLGLVSHHLLMERAFKIGAAVALMRQRRTGTN